MQFFPSARFFQYSSTFPACGNCPAIPITAIRSLPPPAPFPRGPLAAAFRLSALLWLLLARLLAAVRHDLSFLAALLLGSFGAINSFWAIGFFSAFGRAGAAGSLTPATFPN